MLALGGGYANATQLFAGAVAGGEGGGGRGVGIRGGGDVTLLRGNTQISSERFDEAFDVEFPAQVFTAFLMK